MNHAQVRRVMTRALLALGLGVAGCGGKGTTTGGTTVGPGSGDGSATPVVTGADAAPAPTGPLTEAECADMIGHILDVGVAEQRRTLPPEQVPTPEQVAATKKRMIEQGKSECLQFDRASFACVMAAADSAALESCAGAEAP